MHPCQEAAARPRWPAPGLGALLALLLAVLFTTALRAPAAMPMCRARMPALLLLADDAAPAQSVSPARGWEPGGLGLLDALWLSPVRDAWSAVPRPARLDRRVQPPQPWRRPRHGDMLRLPGAIGFQADLERLLPRYRADFEEAARVSGLDWRLLAAMGYQESHWNPSAQSPTGVRGLMMLTQDTALDLGVNREDARQSILGAGRLLRGLYQQLPSQIREPDRTAMALAAYNQGLGHLQDARDVADLRGGNPNRWSDVRQALPLLSHDLWVQTTKYGSARGTEAVGFVDGVHTYYARLETLPRGPAGGP